MSTSTLSTQLLAVEAIHTTILSDGMELHAGIPGCHRMPNRAQEARGRIMVSGEYACQELPF
jgi:hypothetical protein